MTLRDEFDTAPASTSTSRSTRCAATGSSRSPARQPNAARASDAWPASPPSAVAVAARAAEHGGHEQAAALVRMLDLLPSLQRRRLLATFMAVHSRKRRAREQPA